MDTWFGVPNRGGRPLSPDEIEMQARGNYAVQSAEYDPVDSLDQTSEFSGDHGSAFYDDTTQKVETYQESPNFRDDYREFSKQSEPDQFVETAATEPWISPRLYFCLMFTLSLVAGIAITGLVVGGIGLYDSRHVAPCLRGSMHVL
jgi:hypothetical protein